MRVELDVGDGSYVVRLPARGVSISIRDEVAIRQRKIERVGQFGLAGIASTALGLEVRRAFDPVALDPEVTRAIIRFAVNKVLIEACIPWWRRLSRHSALVIRWRDWDQIGIQDRAGLLALPPASRIDVNGRTVLAPRVDVPLLRNLLGSTIDLGGG